MAFGDLHQFVPWHEDERVRCFMKLNDADNEKVSVRNRRKPVVVTDQLTQRTWQVRSASCGIRNCYCDAVVIREV